MSIIIMNNDCYNHDNNTNNKNNINNNDSNGIGAQEQEQEQQEKQKVSDMFWYSQKDLEDFRKRNNDIATSMAFGDIIEGDEHTYRGLELHDYRKYKKYRNTCYKAHRAVLLEQEKQLRKGVVDPNIIADVYKKNGAKECQKKAHRIAILDYNDAYRDIKFLDSNITIHNNTKPIDKRKKLILKTSKRKMKEIMLCFKNSHNKQKQNKNNNKIKNDDDEHVIKSRHDDHEETTICDETITNDHLIDEIYFVV